MLPTLSSSAAQSRKIDAVQPADAIARRARRRLSGSDARSPLGRGLGGDRPYLVVDTGGFEPKATSGIMHAMAKQTRTAIAGGRCDHFPCRRPGRTDATGQDHRRSAAPQGDAGAGVTKPKASRRNASPQNHELALGTPLPISSAHARTSATSPTPRLRCARRDAEAPVPQRTTHDASRSRSSDAPNVASRPDQHPAREERVIVFDEPGTTRDSLVS